jgi:hypothetical protein
VSIPRQVAIVVVGLFVSIRPVHHDQRRVEQFRSAPADGLLDPHE